LRSFPRYVTVLKFCELTGYSEEAVKSKRRDGVWLKDREWIKAPDGRILIDIEGYETWVETARVCALPAAGPSESPLPPAASIAGNRISSPLPLTPNTRRR
jgi:hypothetical protein